MRCGEWNTQNEDEDLPYQELDVRTIKVIFDLHMTTEKKNNLFGIIYFLSFFFILFWDGIKLSET